MGKRVSLFESILGLILFGLIIAGFLLHFVGIEAFTLCLIFTSAGTEAILIYIELFSWRGLPKGCMYNPFGFIEIHIENICEGSRKEFMKLCIDMLLYCINNRKNIIMDTWLIRENHIKSLFGNAAELYKPDVIQHIINFIFEFRYMKKCSRKSFRCIIYSDKLTSEQRAHIVEQFTNFNKCLVRN